MKIALAQINTRTGDLAGNTGKILAYVRRARQQGAELVVFPELAVAGYPAEDLIEKDVFVSKNRERLEEIAGHTNGIGVVCGFIAPNTSGKGKPAFNSVALLDDGKISGIQHKTLLPTYDVFAEDRYFEPARERRLFEFRGKKIGLTICEDAWNDADFWRQPLYHADPAEELVKAGADLIINASASPYSIGKENLRLEMFRTFVRDHKVPFVLVNLVGGNDSLIFDGCSVALDASGSVIAKGRAFEEDLVVVDPERGLRLDGGDNDGAWCTSDPERMWKALVMGTRDYLSKCGFRQAVVGLSGGIDSALTAVIACEALGAGNVTSVSMPSRYSSKGSKDDARLLAEKLGMTYKVIPIEPMLEPYLAKLKPHFDGRPEDTTEENLQARIRGNILMAISNKTGAIVLSTGNKSELSVGYATLYGDMCGGLAVLSDVWKTAVYQLANFINRHDEIIPWNTIRKPPSAELKPDQKDEDSLPPYDVLDGILKAYVEDRLEEAAIAALGYEPGLVREILVKVDRNEYKRRQAAPTLRISNKAFGFGRKVPIAQGWR